jgi:transposase, IS5 family
VRRRIPKQSDLFSPLTDHEHARELAEIDKIIIAHPEWEAWVHADLTKGVEATCGRDGMSAGQVLRVRVSQARWNVSLRKFASLFADSLSTREFVGLGPADLAPKYSTLQENLAKVQPETWGRILKALVTSDEVREIETAEKVRVDATVTESNIRQPSDSSLLWDCVRVLTRLMNRGRTDFGLDFEDHSKKAKKLQSRIFFARKAVQRAPAYQELLDVSRVVDEQVVAVLAKLRTFEPRTVEDLATRKVLLAEIERVRALFARVIDQTTRRVINGEKVPAQEKVLSIFEPHTDLIAKKGSRPEFGHKITFTAGPSGLILDCVIEKGNPGDVTLALRQLERQKGLFGQAPPTAAFDGGYASRENFDGAKALGTERPVFSKGRGLTPEEMAGSRRTYGRLRNFRAGIEATVSYVKRSFGLDRCTWKGARQFASYVWSAVIAANLTILARARLCDG